MRIHKSGFFAIIASFLAISPVLAEPAVDQNSFVVLSKKLVPSVVNIQTMTEIKAPQFRGGPDDPFRRFFEDFFKNYGGGN